MINPRFERAEAKRARARQQKSLKRALTLFVAFGLLAFVIFWAFEYYLGDNGYVCQNIRIDQRAEVGCGGSK